MGREKITNIRQGTNLPGHENPFVGTELAYELTEMSGPFSVHTSSMAAERAAFKAGKRLRALARRNRGVGTETPEPSQESGRLIDLSGRFEERARVREILTNPIEDDSDLPPVS